MKSIQNEGCCYTCNGTGTSFDIETNGQCWDCYGTEHVHEGECRVSKYFVQSENGIGPGGQVYFRKGHLEYNWYDVYLDDIKIGKVMSAVGNRVRWTGLSYAKDSEFFKIRTMEGFATRWDAATFIFKHHGYWMRDERRTLEDIARLEKEVNKFEV